MGEHEPLVRRLGRPGDLGWVVAAHGELYDREFGWDGDFEALVARIVADYTTTAPGDPAGHGAWIAELAGRRVGCVFCVPAAEPGTAKLRLLLVDPAARGLGLGDRLVAECLAFARASGRHTVTLWTNDVLTAARRLYLRHGFVLTAEEPHHSFGHDLVGQTWERAL